MNTMALAIPVVAVITNISTRNLFRGDIEIEFLGKVRN
jgi:hypothetical protein